MLPSLSSKRRALRLPRYAPAIALVLLATQVNAQLPPTNGTTVPGRDIGSAHFSTLPGSMSRVVSGELTGDARLDAVVLKGNRPVWMFSPGLYDAVMDNPQLGLDIAILPGGAADGRDALALTSFRGLELWRLDLTTGQLQGDLIEGIAWVGAPRLVAGDLFATGTSGLVGIAAGGTQLLLLPTPGQLTSATTIDLTYTAFDIQLLDWDGVPGLEIALTTSEGLRVLDTTGVELESYPVGKQNDRMAVVHMQGLAHDRLVTVVEVTDAAFWLFTLDKDSVDTGVLLGDVDVVGLATGDYNMDGDDDLLVSHRNTGELLYMEHLGTHGDAGPSYSFEDEKWSLLDLTSDQSGAAPAPENHGIPVLVDLDGDGDADVLAPLEKEAVVKLSRSIATDHQEAAPIATGGVYRYNARQQTGDVVLELEAPLLPVAQSDAIEVVIWRQENTDTTPAPVSVHYDLFPTTGSWPLELTFPIVQMIPSEALYSVEVRLVELDVDGETILSAAPTWVYTISTLLAEQEEFSQEHEVPYEDILPLELIYTRGTPHGTGVEGTTSSTVESEADDTNQGANPTNFGRGSSLAPSPSDAAPPTGADTDFDLDDVGTFEPGGTHGEATSGEGASAVPLPQVPCFSNNFFPKAKPQT